MPSSILIVGGWSFDHQDLEPLLSQVPGDASARVITLPDLNPTSFEKKQSLADRFAQAIRAQPYDLAIGWSLGAMLLIEASLNKALTCQRLLLFSACGRFLQDHNYPEGVEPSQLQGISSHLEQDPQRCVRDFRRACAYPARPGRTTSSWSVEELQEGLSYLETFDVRDRISQLTPSTQMVHGGKDSIISSAAAECLYQRLPSSSLIRLPNAGHDACLRDTHPVSEWIQTALQSTPSPAHTS